MCIPPISVPQPEMAAAFREQLLPLGLLSVSEPLNNNVMMCNGRPFRPRV
jgi:hypothetical protein